MELLFVLKMVNLLSGAKGLRTWAGLSASNWSLKFCSFANSYSFLLINVWYSQSVIAYRYCWSMTRNYSSILTIWGWKLLYSIFLLLEAAEDPVCRFLKFLISEWSSESSVYRPKSSVISLRDSIFFYLIGHLSIFISLEISKSSLWPF